MDQQTLVRLWEEAWSDGIWYAPWEKARDLTAAQAAWVPQPGRHSVWQIVNHMLFWQDYTLRALAGNRPGRDGVDRRNWEAPSAASEPAWAQTRQRFAQSCTAIRDAVRMGGKGLERLVYHLPHESYHMGQIMYLRASQGLPPIE